MANTKISQLSATTNSNDDVWLVMNNSGETETFKIKRVDLLSGTTTPSPFISGDGSDSVVPVYQASSTNTSSNGFIGGGINTITSTGSNNGIIGGSSNSISSGDNSFVGGGAGNTANNSYAYVAGGQNNQCGFRCFVANGYNNNVSGNGAYIIGGENNLVGNAGWGGILGGVSHTMYAGNDIGCQLLGGYANYMNMNGSQGLTIMGGTQNRYYNFDSRNQDTRFGLGAMIGGRLNRIQGLTDDTSGANAYPLILGGTLNKISGAESDDSGTTGATIINSYSSTIQAGSSYSSIIGGSGNTLSGGTNVVMLGTTNRTATTSGTTYVEKLKAFGKNVEITDGTNTTSNIVGNLILGKNNTLSQDKYTFVMGESNNITGTGAPGLVGNIVNGTGNSLGTYAYANFVVGGYNSISQPYNIRMGNNASINGGSNLSIGEQTNITADGCANVGAYNSISTNYSYSFGNNNDITGTGSYNNIWGGLNNSIASSTGSTIVGGSGSTITSLDDVVMLGTKGRTATTSGATFVENLVVFNYAALDFADDTAAAAGGVVLGQIYHTLGAMKIRVS